MMRLALVVLSLLFAPASQAQGVYPGDALRVNDETVSYQRFQGFYVEYRPRLARTSRNCAPSSRPSCRGTQNSRVRGTRRNRFAGTSRA